MGNRVSKQVAKQTINRKYPSKPSQTLKASESLRGPVASETKPNEGFEQLMDKSVIANVNRLFVKERTLNGRANQLKIKCKQGELTLKQVHDNLMEVGGALTQEQKKKLSMFESIKVL